MCGSEVICSKKLYTPWSIYRKFTVVNLWQDKERFLAHQIFIWYSKKKHLKLYWGFLFKHIYIKLLFQRQIKEKSMDT